LNFLRTIVVPDNFPTGDGYRRWNATHHVYLGCKASTFY